MVGPRSSSTKKASPAAPSEAKVKKTTATVTATKPAKAKKAKHAAKAEELIEEAAAPATTEKAIAVVPAKAKKGEKKAEKKAATEAVAVIEEKPKSDSPYQLDKAQTLKAVHALQKFINAAKETASATAKPNLLQDDSDPNEGAEALWLLITTKKYISDKHRLKPSPIRLPHPMTTPSDTTACLIVKDPQRTYKDLVEANPGFNQTVTRVIGVSKLRAKFKTFEQRRQLMDSHDVFLADDRVVTMMPGLLGSTFYRKTAKVPIPVVLAETPGSLKHAVEKALQSTYVHLSPAASTSVRVALSTFPANDVVENIEKVITDLTEKKIPGGWRNVKSLHIKSPNSAALPIYMAAEVYGEEDVLKPEYADRQETQLEKAPKKKEKKKQKNTEEKKQKKKVERKEKMKMEKKRRRSLFWAAANEGKDEEQIAAERMERRQKKMEKSKMRKLAKKAAAAAANEDKDKEKKGAAAVAVESEKKIKKSKRKSLGDDAQKAEEEPVDLPAKKKAKVEKKEGKKKSAE